MRFLHLSDLHLGKRVCEFSMLEDQRYILEEILALLDETPVDGVLLAGDLYDKPVPPAEAVRLLDWFLTQLAARKLPVFAVSGNHDSADRVAFGSALLADSRVYVSPVFTGAPQPIPLQDISFLRVIPSQANYFLCEITGKYTSAELSRLLLDRNILIKDCGTKKAFGGKNYIRIAVKNRDENNRLISILASFDL